MVLYVHDYYESFIENTGVLKPDRFLLLGLPFNQKPHMELFDFWMFTRHGIEYLLKSDYFGVHIDKIDSNQLFFILLDQSYKK